MYKDVLCEDFIEQYKSYHMTLFRELNIMLFDVAFLKECIVHNNTQQRTILDTDIIVSYLFKNNFEHLILKTYRIMFDNGADVLTIDTFISRIIQHLINPQFKSEICGNISNSCWKSDSINATKHRLKDALGEFRDKAIAHKLTKEMKELSVNLDDIAQLLDAAIDIFEMLSFYPLDFYNYKISEYSFVGEHLTVQEKSKQLLDLLVLSSTCISHIDVKYKDYQEETAIEQVQNAINQYNVKKSQEEKCSKLLSDSEIGTFPKVLLLELDDFKNELLKRQTISDYEILEIVNCLMEKFSANAEYDRVAAYKLSKLKSCIEQVKKAAEKFLHADAKE
jgi:hypothetical protein